MVRVKEVIEKENSLLKRFVQVKSRLRISTKVKERSACSSVLVLKG